MHTYTAASSEIYRWHMQYVGFPVNSTEQNEWTRMQEGEEQCLPAVSGSLCLKTAGSIKSYQDKIVRQHENKNADPIKLSL